MFQPVRISANVRRHSVDGKERRLYQEADGRVFVRLGVDDRPGASSDRSGEWQHLHGEEVIGFLDPPDTPYIKEEHTTHRGREEGRQTPLQPDQEKQ